MNNKTRRWVLASGGVTAAAIVVAAVVVVFGSGSNPNTTPYVPPKTSPKIAAEAFLSAIATTDPAGAANKTDNPTAAGAALAAQRNGMGMASYRAKLKEAPADAVTLSADVTWKLPNGKPFAFVVELGMVQVNAQWKVHWAPTVLHPKLADGQHLTYRDAVADGALLGPDGAALNASSMPKALYDAVTGQLGSLKGTDGWEAGIMAGQVFTPLDGEKPVAGEKVTVTIDPAIQKSAQAAVDALPQGAAIVAIDPSNTEIRAVASNDALGSSPFSGQYAPGSTMKIVTGAAALQNGLVQGADTPLDCPAEKTVGTRYVPNQDLFGYPNKISFKMAFAKSCNTTFAMLGHQLTRNVLPSTAQQFGLGTDYIIAGTESNTGKVRPADSDDEQVENSFGQGTVTASPFGMALVAATVAQGKKPMPTLVRGKAPEVTSGGAAPPSPQALNALRTSMRECVTSGTAQALAGYGTVYGKTGTAELNPQEAHGWFVGYRGNVAFAVFVKGAGSSGPAVKAAGQFLGAIG
ncbi:penicillin-binding protein [Lentzea tibetensis]|uniref:Penicillin-binding protein n=1 Tax=Lentzea tibetensis TaxID=2591470 RepID=A0A563ELB2_9PSEU|nr:penicillin-binding transpeptidase domain-containing protein [Lentzea tibetensis]TWP47238.1 penicillin-binding protein [Lentzea tibetensis]